MKYKLTIIALATLLTSVSYALDKTGRDRLIEDLVRVESRGRCDLIGDHGLAYGCLQIHEEMVAEANRIAHHSYYVWDDMFNPDIAREVASVVLDHYNTHIKDVTGREATRKELAFIWNGGGSAWKRVSSPKFDTKQHNLERYWSKVSDR